jgi:hypothetical protein
MKSEESDREQDDKSDRQHDYKDNINGKGQYFTRFFCKIYNPNKRRVEFDTNRSKSFICIATKRRNTYVKHIIPLEKQP